jgi:hypothetical protein
MVGKRVLNTLTPHRQDGDEVGRLPTGLVRNGGALAPAPPRHSLAAVQPAARQAITKRSGHVRHATEPARSPACHHGKGFIPASSRA